MHHLGPHNQRRLAGGRNPRLRNLSLCGLAVGDDSGHLLNAELQQRSLHAKLQQISGDLLRRRRNPAHQHLGDVGRHERHHVALGAQRGGHHRASLSAARLAHLLQAVGRASDPHIPCSPQIAVVDGRQVVARLGQDVELVVIGPACVCRGGHLEARVGAGRQCQRSTR